MQYQLLRYIGDIKEVPVEQPIMYQDVTTNQWCPTTVLRWGRGYAYVSTGTKKFWVPDKRIKLRHGEQEEA